MNESRPRSVGDPGPLTACGALSSVLANVDTSAFAPSRSTFGALSSVLANVDTSAFAPSRSTFGALSSVLGKVDTDSLFTAIITELGPILDDEANISEADVDVNDGAGDNLLSKEARVAIAAYTAVLFFSICAYLYLAYPTVAKLVIDAGGPASWAMALAGFTYERMNGKRH